MEALRIRKGKKVNFTLRPSTYVAVSKVLYYKDTSLNNLVNTLLEKYVQDNVELLEKYNRENPSV